VVAFALFCSVSDDVERLVGFVDVDETTLKPFHITFIVVDVLPRVVALLRFTNTTSSEFTVEKVDVLASKDGLELGVSATAVVLMYFCEISFFWVEVVVLG